MSVKKATKDDLNVVLSWLEAEYKEDNEGFWSNRNIIEGSYEAGDLWVILQNGEAVAFQVGDHAAVIACVRKNWQRKGLGTQLFMASLERAYRDGVNVLFGECSPPTSFSFWQKHGFERYGNETAWGGIPVRRVLEHKFTIPPDAPRADVTISFYPEAVNYEQDVLPIMVHRVVGAHLDDGTVKLDRRVVGFVGDEPRRKDLCVKIEVDGVLRCFCKAKYDEAEAVGVKFDRKGAAFYIDAVASAGAQSIFRPG